MPDIEARITRRTILVGAAASLICAPAIVQAVDLMPVRRLPFAAEDARRRGSTIFSSASRRS